MQLPAIDDNLDICLTDLLLYTLYIISLYEQYDMHVGASAMNNLRDK